MQMKKKEFRTVRVSLDAYKKLSVIMGDEIRRRKRYVSYSTVIEKLCSTYFGRGFGAKKEKKGK